MAGEEYGGVDWSLWSLPDDTARLLTEPKLALATIEPNEHACVDWDSLQIQEIMEEEGIIEVCSERQLCILLGLRDDKTTNQMEKEGGEQPTKTSATEVPNVVEGGNIITVDDYIEDETMFVYDKDNPSMEVGSLYPSMQEFRLAIRQYAIRNEFELGIEKTDKMRFRGYCKDDDCQWSIVGHTQEDLKTVMVTMVKGGHTCTSTSKRRTITPSSKWVAWKAIPILRQNPQMGPKELQTKLQEDHKCKIGYGTVWKGKEKALDVLYGTWKESFQQLFNWREEVLRRDPNCVINIECKMIEGKYYFHRFFCALSPCIEGFRTGCRPWLGVDSTALNGRWNGQLASACSVDGHNWLFPVAFGLFDSETEDNWVWFMKQLHNVIGDLPVLAICTDACPGLIYAVKHVFPQAEQRECFRHLMQNFIKRYRGQTSGHMWPAARAYKKTTFDKHMDTIYSVNPDAKEWINKHHKLKWMRSDFNAVIKCDYITNNVAESFNNWIRDIKDLPVADLVDKIREKIMGMWHTRRNIARKLTGKVLPAIIQVLKARTRGLGHLSVIKGDNFVAEVWDNNSNTRYIVKALLHECSCLEWQHTGKPCQHGLALIISQQTRNANMEDFIHEYYSVEKFWNAYAKLVEPLDDKSEWPDVELPFTVAAPLSKRSVGRRRKLRFKSCLEGGSKGSKARKSSEQETEKNKKMVRGKIRCPNCGELGHRKSSYKCPQNGTKKRKRKPRKNTTKGYTPKCLSTPNKPITKEAILQESPRIVTRRRLATLMVEAATSHEEVFSSQLQAISSAPKKLTPKKPRRA